MATILRDWSYRYQWFYDTVSALAALSVGGEQRMRKLFLKDLGDCLGVDLIHFRVRMIKIR
jgi:hypothetical protein